MLYLQQSSSSPQPNPTQTQRQPPPQSSSATGAPELLLHESSSASSSVFSSSLLPTDLCLNASSSSNSIKMSSTSNTTTIAQCWWWPDLLTAWHSGRGRAVRSVELSLSVDAVTNRQATATASTSDNNNTTQQPAAAAAAAASTTSSTSAAVIPQQQGNNNSNYSCSSSSSSWMYLFLQTLGRGCPKLTTLRVYAGHYRHPDTTTTAWTIPAPVLADLLRTCPQLQSLVLIQALHLQTRQDVQVLAQALQQQQRGHALQLREIKLLDLRVGIRESNHTKSNNNNNNDIHDDTGISLDPIFQALSTIETLESVDLSLHDSSTSDRRRATATTTNRSPEQQQPAQQQPAAASFFSPPSLALLLNGCRGLTDITLWHCHLSEAHLHALILPLQRHATLQFVSLRHNPGIGPAAWCHFYTHGLRYCYSLHTLLNDHADLAHAPHPALLTHQAHQAQHGSSDSKQDNDNDWAAAAATAAELFLGLNVLGRGVLLQWPAVKEQQQQQNNTIHNGHNHHCAAAGNNHTNDDNDDRMISIQLREDWVDLLDSVSDSPTALYYMIRDGVSQWLSLVSY